MSKTKKKIESFVLNDESVINSNGFRVPNNQIGLVRFSNNAVLLYMHRRGEVHGVWVNLRTEGSLLLADPVFDLDDPESAKIAGKVERGFIKGASLYLHFTPETKFVEAADGVIELHGTEAFEGSIVDIPSNAKSIKLFADGEELDDDKIKGFMLSATSNSQSIKIQNKNEMDKVLLSAPAIAAFALAGITPGDTTDSVNSAVTQLGAKLQAEQTAHNLEKTQRVALDQKIKDQENAQLTAMVDQAVVDGQIVGSQKEDFIALGFDAAKKIIGGLPKKVSLGAMATAGVSGDADPKSLEEFEKMPLAAQLAFKNDNPAGYAKLFA